VAAAAIVVAVVVAITSGSSSKTVSTKPPPAVGIVPFASSVLQPVTFTRTMPNGVKLTISTTGTMQVGVQRLILQPGGFEPWHEHPGSGLAIVEQGTIDDYEQNAKGTGCTLFQLSAGQARFDPGNNPHSLVNPTKKPVTVWVATFAPPHTAPLTSKPKPAGCAAP
jgi:quercetin dioxygenase-like cupin family protein